jgi:5-formyltetrahydrofolate cyclo-ligase
MTRKQEKERLRAEIYKKIKRISKARRLKEKEEIQEKLEKLPVLRKAKTILFFWSLSGEVGTKDLIERLRREGKRIALPVVINEKEIKPYEYKGEMFLKQNKWGIKEPDREKTSEVKIQDLDLVVVPGVAFDKENKRLGRGKGYYDRFIQSLSDNVTTIGLAFSCQIVEALPFDPLRDKKVDMVISA